jgi:hypothetical protein
MCPENSFVMGINIGTGQNEDENRYGDGVEDGYNRMFNLF